MVRVGEENCPKCGNPLKYYDTRRRIVLSKKRSVKKAYIRRLKCTVCQALHSELPDYIFPYKRYDAEIIQGVLEGLITSDTLGFENYPCAETMDIWRTRNLQGLLWKEQ